MKSVQRTNYSDAPPPAGPFLTTFTFVVMSAVILATAPVYAGADPAYLTALTPFFQWVPFLTVIILHRLRPRHKPKSGDPTSPNGAPEHRGDLWSMAGAFPRGMIRPIVVTSALALGALLCVALVSILAAAAAGFIELRSAQGGMLAAALTVPVSIVFMVPVAGEELAWRGYLTTILSPRGFLGATLTIGALWALWHVPLTAALAYAGELGVRDVFAKTVDLLLASVFLSALRYLSGSVWPAVFAHALFNNLFQMAQYNFMTPPSTLGASDYWGYLALSWSIWLVLDAALVLMVRRRTIRLASQGLRHEDATWP